MKTVLATAAVIGLALGALSPVFAADEKKCDVGMEWDKTTQQCIKKQS